MEIQYMNKAIEETFWKSQFERLQKEYRELFLTLCRVILASGGSVNLPFNILVQDLSGYVLKSYNDSMKLNEVLSVVKADCIE